MKYRLDLGFAGNNVDTLWLWLCCTKPPFCTLGFPPLFLNTHFCVRNKHAATYKLATSRRKPQRFTQKDEKKKKNNLRTPRLETHAYFGRHARIVAFSRF